MFADFKIAARLLLLLTLVTGVAYPLAIYGLGSLLFPAKAAGSLLYRDGVLIGSELLAQKFSSPRYFQARPSASDYATLPSGASNLSPNSKVLAAQIAARQISLGAGAPGELLTSSGSGLDPDLSIAGVEFQLERVSAARQQDAASLRQALLAPADRYNVLLLNLALDRLFP